MKILIDEELLKQALEALESRCGTNADEQFELLPWLREAHQKAEKADAENKAWEHLKPYGYAPGYYSGKCCECGKEWFNQDKYAWVCRECAEKMCAAGGSTGTTKLDTTQEIEFLEALLAADNALIEGLKNDLADCQKQRDELATEVESLKREAAKYRLLREACTEAWVKHDSEEEIDATLEKILNGGEK